MELWMELHGAYVCLGLSEGCTWDEVRQAYKHLAFRWHPDRNPDNVEEAEDNFKQIYSALQLIETAMSHPQPAPQPASHSARPSPSAPPDHTPSQAPPPDPLEAAIRRFRDMFGEQWAQMAILHGMKAAEKQANGDALERAMQDAETLIENKWARVQETLSNREKKADEHFLHGGVRERARNADQTARRENRIEEDIKRRAEQKRRILERQEAQAERLKQQKEARKQRGKP